MNRQRPGVRGVLLAGWTCALAAAASFAAGGPDAETLLRRADLVRNPFLGTAIDLELSVASRDSGRELRGSHFTMLTHSNGRTLLLMPQADRAAPGALLIAEDTYWLLLPHAEQPVELAFRHVVAGDLSHAGFLRVDLRARYQAHDDGEETLDGVACRRLELVPKSGEPAPFGRVRYWVAKTGFLPIRIEFYGAADELRKTARFVAYRGRQPLRIEIEDSGRPDERATLTLGRPQGVKTAELDFDLDDLAALRDAARRLAVDSEAPVSGKRLVEALRAKFAVECSGHETPAPAIEESRSPLEAGLGAALRREIQGPDPLWLVRPRRRPSR